MTRFGAMKLYFHQIYELKKGVRHLVLCTMSGDCAGFLSTVSKVSTSIM